MEILGIYVRVSSKSQEDDGTSIEYQIKKGKEISKKLGMNPIIYNEGGKSSWDSNINTRIELVRLLNNVESKKIKSVWVWNMDRIGRNSQSWYSILKILVGYKVNLYVGESLKPYDFSNPTDRLVTNILSLITTYDNELRRTRMIFGKMESLKKGRTFIGGTIPMGYDVDKNKNLIPHPLEKKIVLKMYEMYRDGKSTTDIQVMLNNSSHFPRRSKKGWNLGTIQKMLRNTIYNGTQLWRWKELEPDGSERLVEEIQIKTPRIITNKLWMDVQKRLDSYNVRNQYDTDITSLLKGLLVCDNCGLPMNHRYRSDRMNNYYYCVYSERSWVKRNKSNSTKYQHQDDRCDMKKSLVMEQTDEMLWDEFLRIFSNSKWVKEQYKTKGLKPKKEEVKKVKNQINENRRLLSEHKQYLESLNSSLIDVELKNIQFGFKSENIYKGLLNKITKQIDEVNKEIDKVKEDMLSLQSRDKWIDWVSNMSKEVEEMKEWNEEEKREKLEQFIKKIYVTYDSDTDLHSLSIDFNVPIVGDKIIYLDGKDKSKGYEIKEGVHNVVVTHKNKRLKLFTPSETKLELISLVTKLKSEGKSYLDISNYLNKRKIKTIRGKKWDKYNVGRFYNYSTKNKVELEVEKSGDLSSGKSKKK